MYEAYRLRTSHVRAIPSREKQMLHFPHVCDEKDHRYSNRPVYFCTPFRRVRLSFWRSNRTNCFLLQQRYLRTGRTSSRRAVYLDSFDSHVSIRSPDAFGPVALGSCSAAVLLSRFYSAHHRLVRHSNDHGRFESVVRNLSGKTQPVFYVEVFRACFFRDTAFLKGRHDFFFSKSHR
jgi:hypothetical protein